jgi:hypothetical protein
VIDRNTVVRGVVVTLALLVPPVAVIRTLLGPDSDSPLWNLIVVVFLVSFPVGGAVAANRAPTSPLKHAAAAGAAAFGVALLFGLVRNAVTGWSLGLAGAVTALLLWQIATSLALLGGGGAGRRRRLRCGSTTARASAASTSARAASAPPWSARTAASSTSATARCCPRRRCRASSSSTPPSSTR